MPPAARITDMHVCPMVTGIVPHVGGPILPPGVPTVLIDMLPAANVTTMATCVGPPDIIGLQPPEQWILFHYAAHQQPGIRTLVVGIFDFQLTTPDHTSVNDLVFDRMVSLDLRFPIRDVAAAYGFGLGERMQLGLVRAIPMIANRGVVWGHTEKLRRSLGTSGLPNPGDEGNPDSLEANSPQDFDNQARGFLHDPCRFNPSFEAIFREARAAGMKVVIVIMPMSPSHRGVFYSRPVWPQYVSAVTSLAHQEGTQMQVIDASNWVAGKEGFTDHVHMTPAALNDFSIRLGKELAGSLPH